MGEDNANIQQFYTLTDSDYMWEKTIQTFIGFCLDIVNPTSMAVSGDGRDYNRLVTLNTKNLINLSNFFCSLYMKYH